MPHSSPIDIRSGPLRADVPSASPNDGANSEPIASFAHTLDEYDAGLALAVALEPFDGARLLAVLMQRDDLAAQAQAVPRGVLGRQARMATLDERLRRRMTGLNSAESALLEQTRGLFAPPADHWWWYPSRAHPLWTIAALCFLTLSLSLFTDFTRRLLSSDPDEIGILSIAIQALLAVGASSTFTESGTEWLRVQLSRRRSRWARPHVVKLIAVIALFALVFSAWEFLPTRLATYYNNLGYHLWTTQPDAALRLYERANRLDPELPQTHVNLAALYDKELRLRQCIHRVS